MTFICNTSLMVWILSAVTLSTSALATRTFDTLQTRKLVIAQGTLDQEKANADEQLLISVDLVESMVGGNDPCRTQYLVDATVVQVTKGDVNPGDSIEFYTYYIHYDDSQCQGYTGPSNPTQVSPGWCGNAWLDKGSSPEAPLELAASGESLQADYPTACPTLSPTMAPTAHATGQPYDELLLVEIPFTEKLGTSGCVTTYAFTGKIESVRYTTVGFEQGDSVYFTMAHLEESSNCIPTQAIEAEPIPDTPWCGYIKLNDGNSISPQGTFIAVDLQSTSQGECSRRRTQAESFYGPTSTRSRGLRGGSSSN
ncbi:expressed unknown protein [Seminavis robusta]|uniref:Uncharacterized protein n=1 Tax=Seminavis robusta TaxID=568900 RepID=A0A9N8H8L4_9STRA|nr:expressed unknown protein [Seminavis robusta]|eukprot:Sro173_g076390.1 n/a (311) ;mRNA; r:65418-66350